MFEMPVPALLPEVSRLADGPVHGYAGANSRVCFKIAHRLKESLWSFSLNTPVSWPRP
ncbi:hypothetical protein EMIT0P2_10827 [Pseudomonas sp. IT-P2]